MAVGTLRSGDWPAARHIGRCAAPPANHRCAVCLLPLLREEFRQLKLILHSELRRRAVSRRALPCPSSFFFGGGTPAPFGCALARLAQRDLLYSSVAVKRNSWSLTGKDWGVSNESTSATNTGDGAYWPGRVAADRPLAHCGPALRAPSRHRKPS